MVFNWLLNMDSRNGGENLSVYQQIQERNMLIQVIYSDNSPGQVRAEGLDDFILNRKIISFHRSEGWVRIGFDPVRWDGGNYNGTERRGRSASAAPLRALWKSRSYLPSQPFVFPEGGSRPGIRS
jgi:hypothetical protein